MKILDYLALMNKHFGVVLKEDASAKTQGIHGKYYENGWVTQRTTPKS